jgi:hypothetical protein
MEAIHTSKTLVLTRATWHNIPEDSILNRHEIRDMEYKEFVKDVFSNDSFKGTIQMLDLVGVQEVGWDSGGTENSHTHISLEKE